MTAISWKNEVYGDWSTPADWSTNTVPGSGDAVTISISGPYVVTITSAAFANSLTFSASQASLVENAGSLTMAGTLTVDSGFVSLNKANTIGGVAIAGGRLAFGNSGALGAGGVALSGGELLATANETLTNDLSFSGSSTIAAAHGTTLNENAHITINPNATLNFGALGQDGVVIWHAVGYDVDAPFGFNVAAGTLKAGDSTLSGLIQYGGRATTVAAGATFDTAGFGLASADLVGGGSVIDSGGADILTLGGANFSGVISGAQSLIVNGTVILTGNNTYTGTTTISSGMGLELGLGGTTGSIGGGAIADGGTLYIFRSNALTLKNAISGAGVLRLIGSGVTSINSANTYTGGTFLYSGALAVGNGGALGAGALTMSAGELLATASETLTNGLLLSGSITIAATHGTTLNENASSMNIAGSSTLNFGAPGQDGTILWHTPLNTVFNTPYATINVQAGTLRGADIDFGFFLSTSPVTVAVGATIDLAGSGTEMGSLSGGGSVINSGAAKTLTLDTANFSGIIAGALTLQFAGNASLFGVEAYTGGATLLGSATVANSGTYDIVSSNGLGGTSASLFVNTGVFEKTGGGGVSNVGTNFLNSGTLNVLDGSMKFLGGFTNNGVIHGLVTQAAGIVTISAAVHDDFNGKGLSGILWTNASGDASIWSANGAGGFAGQDLGTGGSGWQVAGSSDFNGDGRADILWSNASGDAAIWNSNGSGGFTPTDLGTAGSGWQVAGVGDFNGIGESGILWSNASGDTSIWNANGAGGFVGQDLATAGSGWKVAGVGDFNGDGEADILWSNASGDTSIWNSNGAGGFAGQDLSTAGSGWSVAGVGDFNGDGKADILWSNASGDTSIWKSNGSGGFTGQDLSTTGSGWRVASVGDYNGDGKADILWSNASGDTSIWSSNFTGFSGHDLGTAGSGWKPQGV